MVPGARLYPLVPPLPVLLESSTTGPPPFRGIGSIRTRGGCRGTKNLLDNRGPRSEGLELLSGQPLEEPGELGETALASTLDALGLEYLFEAGPLAF